MEKPKLETVDFEMCDICGKEVKDGNVYEAAEGYCCQGCYASLVDHAYESIKARGEK